ncbi:MAG: serine/threonine-protein kinase [Kofleriaceae bacterium]
MASGERDPDDDPALAKTDTPPEQTLPSISAAAGLGDKPNVDGLGRAVARARIANKLFATEERVKLGRYHLLEMVGSGGMGVVWGAWDPELDRRVAIKLVKTELASARERIVREGQALAKLSHPNVVPVYDVGVVEEQVYLVMEWVRGKTLRAYCREPHSVREILAVYRAAGEGLLAAHRAGLIHRDFKPDNAMLGDDGRVRVLDFGLARNDVAKSMSPDGDPFSSDLTRGAGTPRYMPVEQAAGETLTPAVDQYAFCVSVREALAGREGYKPGEDSKSIKPADVPRWLDDILDRGTARLAADRYPSMDDVLRALARDPATVWRRRIAIAGALGVAGAAFAIGSARGGEAKIETCTGAADEIARSWNASTRATLTAHLGQLGPYAIANTKRLVEAFDDHGTKWAQAHQAACHAHEVGGLTAPRYEQNLGCLARTRVALETIVEVLSRVSLENLPSAVAGAAGLPSPSLCLTEAQMSTIDPPPAAIAASVAVVDREVARVRMLALSQDREAIGAARQSVQHAVPLKYAPLVSRARLEYGNLLGLQGVTKQAIGELQQATASALEGHDDDIAVESYARMIYLIGATEPQELDPTTKMLLGATTFFEAIAMRLGPRGTFARALLFNNAGTVELATGHQDQAAAWFQRAFANREATHEKHAELNVIWGNLALVTTDPKRREELLAAQIRELQELHGDEHPMTLSAGVNVAMTIGNPERSRSQLAAVCERFRTVHPHLVEKLSECSYELGWLEEERGDARAALAAMRFVKPDDAAGSPEADIAQGYILMLEHHEAAAEREMTARADTLVKQEHLFSKLRSVDAAIVAAISLVGLRRTSEARTLLARALVTLEGLGFLHNITLYQRRLARVRTMLARLAEPGRAGPYATPALVWYRSVGGYERVVAELAAMGSY